MARLILKFKDEIMDEYPLDGINSLAIGRRSSNDVVIVNLAVSGFHAQIIPQDDKFMLKDLDSKNGTLLNKKPIKTGLLEPGDEITIGKHTLIFDDDHGNSGLKTSMTMENTLVFENPTEVVDQTMIIDTRKQSARPETGLKHKGVIQLSGTGESIPLDKQLIKIGKNKDADIVVTGLSGLLAGDTAATISRRPDGYYISAGEGFLVPKVRNSKLTKVVRLRSGDTIRIGFFKMIFFSGKRPFK